MSYSCKGPSKRRRLAACPRGQEDTATTEESAEKFGQGGDIGLPYRGSAESFPFSGFPVIVCGMASRIVTTAGTMNFAMTPRQLNIPTMIAGIYVDDVGFAHQAKQSRRHEFSRSG